MEDLIPTFTSVQTNRCFKNLEEIQQNNEHFEDNRAHMALLSFSVHVVLSSIYRSGL